MKPLLVVGAGGHGRVVADLAQTLGWQPITFVDDEWPDRKTNRHWPLVGRIADLERLRQDHGTALAAIGANATRLDIHRKLLALGFEIPVLVHPTASISPHARVGRGTVAIANAVVNAFALIGDAVILNTGSTVDHDCRIGDGVHVAPGAHIAGTVAVGPRAWVGIGAAISENLNIGQDAVIGAGAVAIRDISDGIVAVGVPARPINKE